VVTLSPDDAKYRDQLLGTAEKAQELFDRTLLTLSGGALGVSFAFVKQFVGQTPMLDRPWLVTAWAAWVGSLVTSLLSHYASVLAHERAIVDVDHDRDGKLGKALNWSVRILNGLSLVGFLSGLGFMAAFVHQNLK
jgi:hypothetical protein